MKIAYLCDRKYYLHKMSRVRFHSIKAISEFSNVFWGGPNWDNWDSNEPVDKNLAKNNFKPDLIIGYKPLEIKGFADSQFKKCIRYNEMYDKKWTAKEINESKADIIVCHHQNDFGDWSDKIGLEIKIDKNVKLINIPHCAEHTVFKDYKLEKTIDILLVGAINVTTKLGVHYPLRHKMVEVLMSMSGDYNTRIFQHPGYDLSDAHTDKYAIEFAKAMNSSKICVTCSGEPKSRFGKYVEIPMCRSAIAADIPDETQAFFRKFVIEINLKDTNDAIVTKLKEYLDNENKLKQVTDRGFSLSQKFNQQFYASIFIEKIRKILNIK